MFRRQAISLAVVVLLNGSISVGADAQTSAVLGIAAGDAMNGIVDNIRGTILQSLAKLDQSISSGTFLARMQLNNLLAEVDYRATQVTGKTFGQLDKTQQDFFRNARLATDDLKSLGDRVSEDADRVAERAEFVLGNTVIGSNEPRIRSVLPRVVSATASRTFVPVTIDGSWLANAPPTLAINRINCELGALTEPKAVFTCPKEAFAGPTPIGVRYVNGTFSAAQDRSLWQRFTGLFGVEPAVKSYPVSIAVVPDQAGTFALSASALVDRRTTNTRAASYDTGSQHCVWGSETTLNVSPAGPGWSIDVNSIQLTLRSGEMSRLQNVTANGFQVYAVGHNHGNCTHILGQLVANDARGWANGSVTWTEFKTEAQPVTAQLFSGALRWGESRVFPLPDRFQGFVVTADTFNGTHKEYNHPGRDEFVEISGDASGTNVRISSRSIDDSFR